MPFLLDDSPKVLLAAFLIGIALVHLIVLLSPRSYAGAIGCRLLRGRGRHWLVAIAAALIFYVVAEDKVAGERQEGVMRLDEWVRLALREDGYAAAMHGVAVTTSWITGEGLVVVIGVVAGCLLMLRRIRDAAVLLGAVLGAWGLSGLLKLVFSIPRPRASPPWSLVSSFGFPSGHALVTFVVAGLLAWWLGRRARPLVRASLYGGAILAGLLAGFARVVLDAHWMSDVIGALSLGILCLSLLTLAVSSPRRRSGRPPRRTRTRTPVRRREGGSRTPSPSLLREAGDLTAVEIRPDRIEVVDHAGVDEQIPAAHLHDRGHLVGDVAAPHRRGLERVEAEAVLEHDEARRVEPLDRHGHGPRAGIEQVHEPLVRGARLEAHAGGDGAGSRLVLEVLRREPVDHEVAAEDLVVDPRASDLGAGG